MAPAQPRDASRDAPAPDVLSAYGGSAPDASAFLRRRLADLHPAYFALCMATGIVAIAAARMGLTHVGRLLAQVTLVAYPLLWALLLARACLHPRRFLEDLTSHQRAPGLFTLVAATGVLGAQTVIIDGSRQAALPLWWACLVLWGFCLYGVLALLAVRPRKPSLRAGLNGGWLTAVVATQSVAVLGGLVEAAFLEDRALAHLLLLCFWLAGGMLYLWIIGLIFYRYMFLPFSPRDLMPPYWINMGAMAISTLAGTLLLDLAGTSPVLGPLRPFLLGLTVLFWATATWWIPMLVTLGAWRHGVRRVEFAYDPQYWGLVFPLGMYAVCTYRLQGVLQIPALLWLARVFVVVALCAWLLTFLGLLARWLYALLLVVRQLRVASAVSVPARPGPACLPARPPVSTPGGCSS